MIIFVLLTLLVLKMKKILIIAALMLGFVASAAAQPKAIGLRGGYGAELSYQHYLGSQFVEADLGLTGFNALNVAATYNWFFYQSGGFGFYGGLGGALGFNFEKQGMHLAFAPQLGIEYTFPFHLNLSLDIRPQIGYSTYEGPKESSHFYIWYYPALGIRYAF